MMCNVVTGDKAVVLGLSHFEMTNIKIPEGTLVEVVSSHCMTSDDTKILHSIKLSNGVVIANVSDTKLRRILMT